jgi:hypothetical protein
VVRIEASYQLDLSEVIVDGIDHSADERCQRRAGSGKFFRTTKSIRRKFRRIRYAERSLVEGTSIFRACRFAAFSYRQICIGYDHTGVSEIAQSADEITDPACLVLDVWRAVTETFDNNVNGGLNLFPASYS